RITGNVGYSVAGVDLADIFAARYSRPDTPLAASLPDTAAASCSTSGASCTAQATVQVTAGGGFPGYTYAWTVTGAAIVAGQGTDTITIEADPTDAADVQATVSCQVSDSQNGVVDTNDCIVTFSLVYESDLEASLPVSANAECSTSGDSCVASVNVPVLVSKGKPPYSYEWYVIAGSCSFQNGSQNQQTATIARSTSGNVLATVGCRVTDASGKQVSTNSCTIGFQYHFINNLSASIPDAISGDCSTSGDSCVVEKRVDAVVRGGKPPYSYEWQYDNGTGETTWPDGFTNSYVVIRNRTNGDDSVRFRVKVTDSLGYSVYSNYCTFTAHYNYVSNLAVSIPSSASASCSTTGSSCTASVTVRASVSGGKKPYSYNWYRVSGQGYVDEDGTYEAVISGGTSGSVSGTFRVKVTDAAGYVKYSGYCTVTFNYTYSGGHSGCVVVDGVTPTGRIGDVRVGDRLEGADPSTLEPMYFDVTYSEPKLMRCFMVTTKRGIQLPCSQSARIATRDGWILTNDLLGREVPVDDFGEKYFDPVIEIMDIGEQWVQHIAAHDGWYWAGRRLSRLEVILTRFVRRLQGRPFSGNGRYILHHNKIDF
ncbi:MAG TPA: hypothetical protein VFL45_08345, partial [Gammaproteobacteria bacterium]|nr:hypothetical protein [Gammaproteobacteria bacterium]